MTKSVDFIVVVLLCQILFVYSFKANEFYRIFNRKTLDAVSSFSKL